MSIFRSGLVNATLVQCIRSVTVDGFRCEEGKSYELVLDLGAMYVLKVTGGAEIVAPKDAFAPQPQA